jgi:outer membrane protein OmpA-like peptidoglycan-associated protein
MASRLVRLLVILSTAGLAGACAARQAAPVTQFALLPDPDDGSVGRATVSNPAGTKELSAAQESTSVVAGKPPSAVTHLEPAAVQRVFGEALAGLPPAPRHFTLYFQFDSDELTEASRRMVPDVLQVVSERVSPDVIVVGHTDTTGTSTTNYQLGLQRASIVRNLLVTAGLDPALIEVTSHGKADLLVPTPDNTPEPRNRRVEIEIK